MKILLVILVTLPLLAAKQPRSENESGRLFPTHPNKSCRELKARRYTSGHSNHWRYMKKCNACRRTLLEHEDRIRVAKRKRTASRGKRSSPRPPRRNSRP